MGAPQVITICLLAIGLVYTLIKDGEPRGNYSFSEALFSTLINVALLYWGGFFGRG